MKATKDKYLELKNKGLKFISDNQQAIYMTVASYMNLQAAKNFMIRKLQKVNTFGTFLKNTRWISCDSSRRICCN